MVDYIKKVLEENHLISDTNFNNEYNRITEFFNTYRINPTGKQRIPDASRSNGMLCLEEIPFIKVGKKDNNTWLILNNGTKLLIKTNREHKYNEGELLIMYFLKQLNMTCANYDIATYKDKEYLISTSFLRNKELIRKIFDNPPIIKDGYDLMKQYDGQIHFLKTCFADRIYGNIDRFPSNYGVISGGRCNNKDARERLCPLFDNVSKYSILIREEKFGFFPSIDENINSCEEVFSYLLKYEEIMNWVKGPLKKANLYNAAERMKKEKEILIDNKTYQEYESFFKDSEVLINNALKEKQKSFKIKLV